MTSDKLVDLNLDQLNDLMLQHEMSMESIRKEIGNLYEKAQPYLLQIRDLKKQYKALAVKCEATRAFIMMEKGGSLISSIDTTSLQESLHGTGILELDSPEIPKTPERVGRPKLLRNEAHHSCIPRSGGNPSGGNPKLSASSVASALVSSMSRSSRSRSQPHLKTIPTVPVTPTVVRWNDKSRLLGKK